MTNGQNDNDRIEEARRILGNARGRDAATLRATAGELRRLRDECQNSGCYDEITSLINEAERLARLAKQRKPGGQTPSGGSSIAD